MFPKCGGCISVGVLRASILNARWNSRTRSPGEDSLHAPTVATSTDAEANYLRTVVIRLACSMPSSTAWPTVILGMRT